MRAPFLNGGPHCYAGRFDFQLQYFTLPDLGTDTAPTGYSHPLTVGFSDIVTPVLKRAHDLCGLCSLKRLCKVWQGCGLVYVASTIKITHNWP